MKGSSAKKKFKKFFFGSEVCICSSVALFVGGTCVSVNMVGFLYFCFMCVGEKDKKKEIVLERYFFQKLDTKRGRVKKWSESMRKKMKNYLIFATNCGFKYVQCQICMYAFSLIIYLGFFSKNVCPVMLMKHQN